MTDSVALIASAMRADAEALRSISQNVANAQTPAYRREVPLAYSSFDAAAAAAEGLGYPVALKAASPELVPQEPEGARYRVWHVVHHAATFAWNELTVVVIVLATGVGLVAEVPPRIVVVPVSATALGSPAIQ